MLFTLMEIVSEVGYLLFPLTKATNNTSNLEVQDKMHLVVTAVVVLLTIVSLILFVVGLNQEKKRGFAVFAMIILICLALGGMGTGIFSEKYLVFLKE